MATSSFDEQKIRAQLKKWQERLLDLSKGNPLLAMNRSRVSRLRFVCSTTSDLFDSLIDEQELKLPQPVRDTKPDGSEGDESETGSDYRIEPGEIAFEGSPIDLVRKLRRIYDNARTSVEERGVTTLHVTFGTLSWSDDWIGECVTPLWMLPAQLISKGPNAPLRLKVADEEIQINPALELYLRERHHVSLPDLPDEPNGKSLNRYWDRVRRLVSEQHWIVNDDAWLSTFSFEALVIYQDLNAMASAAVCHPVVAALARATPIIGSSEASADELDELQALAIVPVPVLPADGSQLAAMTRSAAGAHVVIHGPPGTGKSQTISNLIADALGRNRKVLFVSSKMAALNVVYQRLADKGLGRFCLEAHSTKAGKTKIIDELKRTLEAEDTADGGRFEEQLNTLLKVRADLNAYVREVHQVRQPLEKTLYQVMGRIARLSSAPEIRAPLPWFSILEVSSGEFEQRFDVLTELQGHAQVFDVRRSHPWRGFSATGITLLESEQLEEDLKTVSAGVGRFLDLIPAFNLIILNPDALSLSDWRHLRPRLRATCDLDRLPHNWYLSTVQQLQEEASLFEAAARLVSDFEASRQTYQEIFLLPLETARSLLAPVTRFTKWFHRFSFSYWRWRSDVDRAAKKKVRHDDAERTYELVLRLLEIDTWLRTHEPSISAETGSSSSRDGTAIAHAANRCRLAAELLGTMNELKVAPAHDTSVSEDFRAAMCKLPDVLSGQFDGALERLDSHFPSGAVDASSLANTAIPTVNNRISELLQALSLVKDWVVLQRMLQRCSSLGLMPFLEGLGSTSAAEAPKAFDRRFHTLWASAIIAQSDVLMVFRPEHHEELARKFAMLDLAVRKLVVSKIRAKAGDPATRLRAAQSTVSGSEVGILRRELQKRRNIKPLRKLFAEIPQALQALKPCMLMSPISVSTYLKPGSITFDLVVFDEASQLPTPEGIAAILRAKQVVVAGDCNQLPPTSFFKAQIEVDENQGDDNEQLSAEEPLESLLDDAVATVPLFTEAHLRWHYRSKDERLIKFSNHFFYENRLVTFPAACTSADGRGVRFEYVPNGVWDRGRSRTNRVEAQRVAAVIVEHFSRYPNRSLGVVAMNAQQKEAIEDAIAVSLENNPEITALTDSGRPEPFFVKSLENVQGDERDVMLISVGYGKDGNGHLSMSFGPLNMDGGWRRLNVLVTRAKWQTIVVTSIRAHELSAINSQNRGAVALRDFLSYAEKNCELPQAPAVATVGETNDFEDAVATELRDRGLVLDQQVGAGKFRIDLAIRDKRDSSRYVLGIECDGATYHSARTARDRDLLRQQVLESMGWRIHRVWSTEWFHDRRQALERILAALTLAEIRPVEESIQGLPITNDLPDVVDQQPGLPVAQKNSEPQRRYRAGTPYRKFTGSANRVLLIESRHADRLAELVVRIVHVEGPLHVDLLLDRLKEVCGVERAGSNVGSNVEEAIQIAARHKEIERRRQRHFLWAKGSQLSEFRLHANNFRRPLEWVHRDEIALATLFLVEDQLGIDRAEIGRAVGRLFGLERVPAEAADYVLEVADELVESGLMHERDGRLCCE